MATKEIGVVKWFSARLGYGFVKADEIEGDVLVHRSQVAEGVIRRGQTVEFELLKTPKGLRAKKVRILNTMVFRDFAGGTFAFVLFDPNEDWTYQKLGGRASHWGTFDTFRAAWDAVEKVRKSTQVWVLFWNRASWKGFVSLEDTRSGNWKGSKYARFGVSIWGEYPTEVDALAELAKLNAQRKPKRDRLSFADGGSI